MIEVQRTTPHVAVGILRRGDTVALVRQGAPGREPFWALPGGVLEEGELIHETLAREVLEETGLEIEIPARLAYIRQIDNRRPEQLLGSRGPGAGYLATVWVFEVERWSGEIAARDPDGFVLDAEFVPVAEAAERLGRTQWLELAAAYLRGEVEPASLYLERLHLDGSVEVLWG